MIDNFLLGKGKGRTRVMLKACSFGSDIIALIYNENAHVGAVAVGEWDSEHQRASVSLITRLGHKDDTVAQKAAYVLSNKFKKPVCVVAGIHLDNITSAEIKTLVRNAEAVVESLIRASNF